MLLGISAVVLHAPPLSDEEARKIILKDAITHQTALNILTLERSSLIYRDRLQELHDILPCQEAPLDTNLVLASACIAYPYQIFNAYKHARNRCNWVLASIALFPQEEGVRDSYLHYLQAVRYKALDYLWRIYTDGGHGIEKNEDKAFDCFLRQKPDVVKLLEEIKESSSNATIKQPEEMPCLTERL